MMAVYTPRNVGVKQTYWHLGELGTLVVGQNDPKHFIWQHRYSRNVSEWLRLILSHHLGVYSRVFRINNSGDYMLSYGALTRVCNIKLYVLFSQLSFWQKQSRITSEFSQKYGKDNVLFSQLFSFANISTPFPIRILSVSCDLHAFAPQGYITFKAAGCKKLCVQSSLESQFIGNRLAPARGLCLIGVLP